MPLVAAPNQCNFCGLSVAAASEPTSVTQAKFRAGTGGYRIRGKLEDLGLNLLDLLLVLITLVVGGMIWSVFTALSGQTPAGKIRDQVLVSVRDAAQAPAWKIIIRQLTSAASIAYVALTVINGFGVVIDVGGYYFATYVIPGLLLSAILLDLLASVTPLRRRLLDWALAIRWADGEGHSFRNYKSPGGTVA